MKVSIIVPVYNEKKTVRQILGRVFFAKLPAGMTCEVIVVNDASADGTDKQLAKIKRKLTAKGLSEVMKLEANTSGTRLLNLYKKRLVKRIDEIRDGGRVWVYERL